MLLRSYNTGFGKKGFLAVLVFNLLIITTCFSLASSQEREIRDTVVNFFNCVSDGKYDKAYNYFSEAIKDEIPLSRFKERARDIRKTKIVKLTIYDQDKYLAKLQIKARINLIYEKRYFEALYGGTCDLAFSNGKWKLISVSLKALEQKEILDKRPVSFGKE